MIHFNIILQLPSDLFPSGLPDIILYIFLLRASRPTQLIFVP
jgi:hypothetical protein